MKMRKLLVALGFTAATMGFTSALAVDVDDRIPEYEKTSGVSGRIISVGSDTLAELMDSWTSGFQSVYKNVSRSIDAKGSSNAPPALTQGSSNFGPMSRKMKDKEIETFEKQYGYKPTPIPVAVDALAVYVNKDNPVKGLNFEQIDAIFSATRKCGASADVKTWGQLGLSGAWSNRGMEIYGRNPASGTYGYFKKKALCKGDYKSSVKEQPGSSAVVNSVSEALNGIGYSGIGYRTSSVRAVPLAKKGTKYVEATPENAVNGSYPLARFLYVYVNKKPNAALPPLEREFASFILSKEGQKLVIKDGYIPLPYKVVKETRKQLDL